MAAFYLFCPGSLISKKHRSKSKEKLKQQTSNKVDPLYETIPAQTRYSHDNRGRHTFVPTGKLPSSLLNSSTNAASVQCSYTPPPGDHQNLGVVSGQTVHVLQQDRDWSYVIDLHNQLGYVPSEILCPLDASVQESWKNNSSSYVNTGITPSKSIRSDSSRNTPPCTPESLYSKINKSNRSSQRKLKSNLLISTSPPQSIGTFHNAFTTYSKTPVEIRTLLHSYRSRQENDLTVRKGEQVTVLNRSDHDWFWVVRGDGEEGFVPATYSISTNSYPGSNHYKHAKLTKTHSHSTGYKSSSSTTNSNQLSAAFSDHLRITPVRSAPHSPADGDLSYLHVRSEPTFDKQRRVRNRKSPDRMTSREIRCTTPNSKRAISLEYIDKKHPYAFSSSLQLYNRPGTSSLHPGRTCDSPSFTPPHSQTSNHFVYPQSIPRHIRPAPDPPSECLYENVNNIYPTQRYTQSYPHVDMQENIYMNAPGLDANGKPSLVPSIMTMQDRILLMDKDPVHFPHSYSDLSIGQTSSLGDIHSVSEFNQYHQKRVLMKEDMV